MPVRPRFFGKHVRWASEPVDYPYACRTTGTKAHRAACHQHLFRQSLIYRYLAIILAALAWAGEHGWSATTPPNIVLIMVDDMGWSDLGCYGGEVRTPNVDRLAQGGLRFTQFYNNGKCCPTRASLLTGLYPHRTGVGRMTFDVKLPGYRGELNRQCATIAELLGKNGYRTAMVGKWHLSRTDMLEGHLRHLNNQQIRETFSDLEGYPVGRGFEEHYGIVWGVANYFDPFSLVHNTEAVRNVPDDYYITDAITDHAVQFLEKYTQGVEPLFLYVAYSAPHWPLHARPEDIKKYEHTYDAGWRAVRQARYERQIEMKLIDPETTQLSDGVGTQQGWDDTKLKPWESRCMEVHAAMIDRVDQGVGRIVDKLAELNLQDDTLILFLSDNGASPERPGAPGFDRVSETRDGRKCTYFGDDDYKKTIMPGSDVTHAGIGQRWANVANAPFRFWKGHGFEGGICTPLVVHWPNGLQTQPGQITDQPGHVIDFMPTFLELANVTYPNEFQGHPLVPLDGKSLLPILRGQQRDGHENLFFEHYGRRGMRGGDWKLVAFGADEKWQLYDLAHDRGETTDLAKEHPDKVQALS
ncbi:MAG: arylsulfatase, partial [Pirellulales bacterium]